jgi:hypothetical protein
MEKWNGEERRQSVRGEFCEQHIGMTNAITEIKTILANIEKNITQGITFKTAMVGSMVAIVLMFIVQIGGFLYLWGRLNSRVEINTEILAKVVLDIGSIKVDLASDRKQIQINTERWNRYLDRVAENK